MNGKPVKACSKCSSFEKYADGRCKPCRREENLQRRAADPEGVRRKGREAEARRREREPEKVRGQGKAWRENNSARAFFLTKRSHCRIKGIPFALETTDCDKAVAVGKPCPIFPWITMSMEGGPRHPAYPELDRIVPALGYVKGNVQWVSQKANVSKQDMTLREAKALENHLALHDVNRTIQSILKGP